MADITLPWGLGRGCSLRLHRVRKGSHPYLSHRIILAQPLPLQGDFGCGLLGEWEQSKSIFSIPCVEPTLCLTVRLLNFSCTGTAQLL